MNTKIPVTSDGRLLALWNRLRSVWRACQERDHVRWPAWGGRGIKVCEEWRRDFRAFLDHVAELGGAERGTTVSLIDESLGFRPGNVVVGPRCHVATYRRTHAAAIVRSRRTDPKSAMRWTADACLAFLSRYGVVTVESDALWGFVYVVFVDDVYLACGMERDAALRRAARRVQLKGLKAPIASPFPTLTDYHRHLEACNPKEAS